MFTKSCHRYQLTYFFSKTDGHTCGAFYVYKFTYKPNPNYSVWVDNGGCVEVRHDFEEGGPETIYSAELGDSLTLDELLILALGVIHTYLL